MEKGIELLNNPEKIQEMKTAQKIYVDKNAAQKIVELLEKHSIKNKQGVRKTVIWQSSFNSTEKFFL